MKKKKLTRVVRYQVLKQVQEKVSDLTHEVLTHHTFKDRFGDKVIFIKYHGHSKTDRDENFGAGMGTRNNIIFQFFVGYKYTGEEKVWLTERMVKIEKYSSYFMPSGYEGKSAEWRKLEIVPLHNTTKNLEQLKREFVIVPYTEERERYLTLIQNKFF